MAEDLSYTYEPLYGAEPYQDNSGAGGARVTGQNLVISAWALADKFHEPPDYMVFGDILKPAAQNSNLPTMDGVAGGQTFHSRHSFKAFMQTDDASFGTLGFVLNPPPEMRQLLAGSVKYNGGDPTDPASYTVSKSLQAAYLWRFELATCGAHNFQIADEALALFSSYLFFNDMPADLNFRIPFLKTNGADGVAPTFFDASIASGVNQMIEAVNDGDGYYIAFSMPIETGSEGDEGNYVNIVYPHSAARG